MMSKSQAIAYGNRVGCKFYVYANVDGNDVLYGGAKRREDAERIKEDAERDYASNPFARGLDVTVRIVEK